LGGFFKGTGTEIGLQVDLTYKQGLKGRIVSMITAVELESVP
jgi:hypothetical protein